MFYHNINPVFLKFGPIEIRYYGLIFVLGFVIAYFMIKYLAKERKINLKQENVETLLIYIAVGVIVFSRIFEILFFNPSFYFSNPAEIIAIWHGGLSFHGGLFGALLAGWLFSKKYKVHILDLADIISIPLALGLCFGRIANFINGELYGRITNVPWCFKFQNIEGCRHPSQLYEAGKNLIIFFSLWFLKKRKSRGFLFAIFLIMYSVLRFTVEYVREPETMVGPLTMGQVLNIPMFLAGIAIIYWGYKNEHKR